MFVQGVAPDAQLITMKVFGKGGGAYDSDYMVAIEDAVMLGCDAVNLSLGSGNAGFTTPDAKYQSILDKLAETDTVVSISAGNSSSWPENSVNGTGCPVSGRCELRHRRLPRLLQELLRRGLRG